MSESEYARRVEELNRLLKRDDKEIREIVQERDQAKKDRKNVESAYSDVQEYGGDLSNIVNRIRNVYKNY